MGKKNNSKKEKDLSLLSNNELKLEMMDLENKYKSIQNKIRKEISEMASLDKEFNKLRQELNKRNNFLD